MAWQYEPKFGVADLENDMCLIEARGGRDKNRMFVRKISNDELLFGFCFRTGSDRVLTEDEMERFPGFHAIIHFLVEKRDHVGKQLDLNQREIIENAMPHYANRFGGYSVCIDGAYYKSLGDVEYVDDIPGY